MSASDYHLRGAPQIREDLRRSDEIDSLLQSKFARWESLEEVRDGNA
jgi:hypothetical protein